MQALVVRKTANLCCPERLSLKLLNFVRRNSNDYHYHGLRGFKQKMLLNSSYRMNSLLLNAKNAIAWHFAI